jgi:hypothetical protein
MRNFKLFLMLFKRLKDLRHHYIHTQLKDEVTVENLN